MLNYDELPGQYLAGMRRYVEAGSEPGHFLSAVLTNDLAEACARADDEGRIWLFSLVRWCYNELPANAWGSPEKVANWMRVLRLAREAETCQQNNS